MSQNKDSKIKSRLFGHQNIPSLIPGVLLALIIMLAAIFLTKYLGNLLPYQKNPLSPVLLAIILGLIIRNTVVLHETFDAGIKFGLKKLLRFGIILMGIRLSIFAVLKIGVFAVGLVIICIAAALIITIVISKKVGISEKLGALIAAGTSICGVSAIVATSPAIEAKEEDIAYAVGTITIFGMLATIAYPYITELILHLPVSAAGFLLGTSVHDTSQVTATALIYDQLWAHRTAGGLSGADIAITTKLVRNTFMVFVIPFLGYWFGRKSEQNTSNKKIKIMKYIPFFVFGYVLMGILRSAGDVVFGPDNTTWFSTWHFIKDGAVYVISIAVACIGLNTDVRKLARLGLKPFLCGFIAACSVGAVSLFLILTFGHVLKF